MTYDVIVIGAGAAGEAAGNLGGELGARIAVIEHDLVGGECGFWACMPSKTLLDAASRRALGASYSWPRASDRRDWMISREGTDYPNDSTHTATLESNGAEVIRGKARIAGPGKVEVTSNGSRPRSLTTRNLIICTGSTPVVPPMEGLETVGFWGSREATSVRDLPSSVVVLGGGPVGVEMAQVYARFGVDTTIIQRESRLLIYDHPRSSEAVTDQLVEEGVKIRTGVTATAIRSGGRGKVVELSDGTTADGAEFILAIGRRPSDLSQLGAEEAGVILSEKGIAKPDEKMRVADGVFVAGDVAGGLQFTHVADYEGRIAVRAALGQKVKADLRSVPRALYTDPETGAVGLTLEQAQAEGIDAFEVTQDFATTARGYTKEGSRGHLTAVIDRERRVLTGAFAACPGASELIHEAVLAIKHAVPVSVLADTIHAFPTAARVFGNLMADALKKLS